MALISCKECSNQISEAAKVCPQCGAKNSKPFWKPVLIGLAGVFIFISLVDSFYDGKAQKREETRLAQMTPEQRQAEIKKKEEDKRNKENRAANSAVAVASLKSALRDPSSLELDWVGVNEKGTVICIDYRAKNGFGGYSSEYITYVNGKASKSADSWNANCAHKEMYNYKHIGALVK